MSNRAAVFETITGEAWRRSLRAARVRRAGAAERRRAAVAVAKLKSGKAAA